MTPTPRESIRMDVRDRADYDPAFRALVNLLTAWLMQHPDYTPTELREAAMLAASRVEYYTLSRRPFVMDNVGNIDISIKEQQS